MMTIRRGPPPPDEGEEDTTYVMSRAEDRSPWARAAAALEKYKLLVYLIGAIFITAGFGFETPRKTADRLRTDMQALSAADRARIDSNTKRVERLERLAVSVEALVRMQCVSAKPEAVRLAGIDCQSWLGTRALPP